MKDLIDGNKAAAIAARLARVQSVPCFPITPQTEIIETIQKWKVNGEFSGQFNQVESEHSVMSAAIGSAMTGARTFTATSSQGLLLMHEMLPIASGTRTPMVMVNVSRGLSAPITLWPDHNDILAMRDSGWIIIFCETNQEVLDSVIMGYKVGENPILNLPVIVNMDGFIHSYTREIVEVPDQKLVDKFLPKFNLEIKLDVKKPRTLGIPVMAEYMKYRAQLHRAQLDAFPIIQKAQAEWKKLTGRGYDILESYRLKDAEACLVIMGPNTTIARSAVDKMRKQGKKVGLLRIRVYRPFPEKQIKDALDGIKKIAVIDQSICPGMSGILYPEIKMALYDSKAIVSNYIVGLGGALVSDEGFIQIFKEIMMTKGEQRRWLM
ncbi:pyruvate ferredoxin oxidoreductase [Candidatus Woesearchaeota archaeon]|nr:pyruvate ferredoxin oxidoreductase [Candidatus Woesearchaeota archaeon]MBW3021646.1 pyruvate ferredoxin oxidoreductase [Candidatus Woesearchaeota archaeon]